MDNLDKEMLLEKFEVVLRTVEDCKWILAEEEGLPEKMTIDKLCIRLVRIKDEICNIDGIVKIVKMRVNEVESRC